MKGELKGVLEQLFLDINSDDKIVSTQANEKLDRILTDTFNIDPLSLFLYDIKQKDCVVNLRKLVMNLEVTDFVIAKALSSLVTHLIIACERDIRLYHDLRVVEVLSLLSDFISGKIDRPEIIEYFSKLM